MTLAQWRDAEGLSLVAAAEFFGIQGSNPSRNYQRYETGERAIPLELAHLIVGRTKGAVSLGDLAAARSAKRAA